MICQVLEKLSSYGEIVSGIGVISPCGRVPCQDLYLSACLLVCSNVYKHLSSLLSKHFLTTSEDDLRDTPPVSTSLQINP